jgi:hypothetical protein
VPTTNSDLFGMMGVAHLLTTPSRCDSAHLTHYFSACLPRPSRSGTGELRPLAPPQCPKALREATAEVDSEPRGLCAELENLDRA